MGGWELTNIRRESDALCIVNKFPKSGFCNFLVLQYKYIFMTIEKQMEILEIVSKETSKSPEAALAFLKALELRTGIKLKNKRRPKAKKQKNA